MSDPEHSDIRGDDDLVAHSEIENRHHSSPPYQPDEQDLAEITLLTAELDEAEKFDLTFEVVDKELDENEYATVRVPDSNIEEENDENNENIENEITQVNNSLIPMKDKKSPNNDFIYDFKLFSESRSTKRKMQNEISVRGSVPCKRVLRDK